MKVLNHLNQTLNTEDMNMTSKDIIISDGSETLGLFRTFRKTSSKKNNLNIIQVHEFDNAKEIHVISEISSKKEAQMITPVVMANSATRY